MPLLAVVAQLLPPGQDKIIECMATEYDFSDICPYDDAVFHEKMARLVREPGFVHALSFCVPPEAVDSMIQELLSINNRRNEEL